MMTVVKTLSEKKLQAFIFDMDGVIIDSEPIHSRVKMETFRHFGIDFDEKRPHGHHSGNADGLQAQALSGSPAKRRH